MRIQNSTASDVQNRLYRGLCVERKYLQTKNQEMKWRRRQCEIEEERGGATDRRGEKKRETDTAKAYLLACRQQFFFRAAALKKGGGVSLGCMSQRVSSSSHNSMIASQLQMLKK